MPSVWFQSVIDFLSAWNARSFTSFSVLFLLFVLSSAIFMLYQPPHTELYVAKIDAIPSPLNSCSVYSSYIAFHSIFKHLTGVEFMATNAAEWEWQRIQGDCRQLNDSSSIVNSGCPLDSSLSQLMCRPGPGLKTTGNSVNLRMVSTSDGLSANAKREELVSIWTGEHYKKWQLRSSWARKKFGDIRKLEGLHSTQFGTMKKSCSIALSAGPSEAERSSLTSIFDVLIMVVSGVENLRDRAKRVMITWGETVPSDNLIFISDLGDYEDKANVDSIPDLPRLPVLRLSEDNQKWDYVKSQDKWKYAWIEMFKADGLRGDNHTWFVTVDDDAFLSTTNLISLLREYDYNEALLIGEACDAGIYRKQPNGEMVFDAFKRICGGAGWVMSLAFARLIQPILPRCHQAYKSDRVSMEKRHEHLSDIYLCMCIMDLLPENSYRLIDRVEFAGDTMEQVLVNDLRLRPIGTGKAVTWHYMKNLQSSLFHQRIHNAYIEGNYIQSRANLEAVLTIAGMHDNCIQNIK